MVYKLAASSWGQAELDAIQSVIDSDRFTMGPKVAEFERRFAAYLGKRFAVMANSGSSANLISTASLFFKKDRPLKRGDAAIVPAVSWSTTYHPLQQYGLKLRIVDVELDTLNIDVAMLEQALTPETKLLVGVSILGNPAALDRQREFADRHGLYFLEDNCESLDAELNGRKTGSFGDLGTHSFFFSHHISTMEGGMVVTDDAELHHLLLAIRAHGWTRDLPESSEIYERRDDDHFEAYRFIVPGYNVRPSEMNGAIGLVQLDKLPEMTEARRRNLWKFQELFEGDDRFVIQREVGKSSSFSFPIVLSPDRNPDRDRIFAALEENEIEFRIITGGCILRHDVMRYYDYECVGEVKNAFIAHDNGFFVGNHPSDQTAQLERLYGILDGAC